MCQVTACGLAMLKSCFQKLAFGINHSSGRHDEPATCSGVIVVMTVASWMCLQVAPRIKDDMQQAGDAMIGFQPLQGLPNFFRIVFPSAWTVTTADLDALMTRIEGFGSKLFPTLQL